MVLALASCDYVRPVRFIGGHITLPGTVYRPLVGVVLVYAASRLLVLSWRKGDLETTKGAPLIPAMLWEAVIGLLSGLTGVVGGIFLSPMLLLMGWAETRLSAGVSAAFILADSVAGLAGNVTAVHKLPHIILLLIPAAILGGVVGSELGSKRLNPSMLRSLLAVALLIAAVKMILPR